MARRILARRDSLFADRFAHDGAEDTYDVLPDGSGFVFLRSPEETRQRLMLIANWPALLRGEPNERKAIGPASR